MFIIILYSDFDYFQDSVSVIIKSLLAATPSHRAQITNSFVNGNRMTRTDTRHRSSRNWIPSISKPFWSSNRIRHGGSDRKTFLFPVSVLRFFDSRVQFEVQKQKPANPHEIRENEETSFVVQTQGVQISKDVSDGGPEGDRTLEPHGCEPCALPAELQAQTQGTL